MADRKPFTLELAKWVMTLTEDECRGYLLYLCGWKPEIIITFKSEASGG